MVFFCTFTAVSYFKELMIVPWKRKSDFGSALLSPITAENPHTSFPQPAPVILILPTRTRWVVHPRSPLRSLCSKQYPSMGWDGLSQREKWLPSGFPSTRRKLKGPVWTKSLQDRDLILLCHRSPSRSTLCNLQETAAGESSTGDQPKAFLAYKADIKHWKKRRQLCLTRRLLWMSLVWSLCIVLAEPEKNHLTVFQNLAKISKSQKCIL